METVRCLVKVVSLGTVLNLAGKTLAVSDDNDVKPNIVMLLADDLGYGDLSCYGNDIVQTPNIDGLAEEGLKFNRMYSQPTCTPARTALLTGSYPVRHGMMGDSMSMFGPNWPVFRSHAQPGGLPCNQHSFLPHILKSKGYVNAMIGKWHLGFGKHYEYLPHNCGFDVFYGTPGSHCAGCAEHDKYKITDHEIFVRKFSDMIPMICVVVVVLLMLIYLDVIGKNSIILTLILMFTGVLMYRTYLFLLHDNPISCILMRNKEILEQPYTSDRMTLRMTGEAVQFMAHSVEKNKPFFLMMSYLQPHVPSFSAANFLNKSKHGPYYDSILEIDWSVGIIINKLREMGVKNDTMIIFASDNGPEITNPITGERNPAEMIGSTMYRRNRYEKGIRLSGEKGSLFEGGLRVPAVISWPDHLIPGSETSTVTSLMDIFPTIQKIINVSDIRTRAIDGKTLVELFKDPSAESHHKILLHFCDMNAVAAVTYNDYKLYYMTGYNNFSCNGVMHQPPLLFNIVKDPGESNPLPVSSYESIFNQIYIEVIKHQKTLLPNIVSKTSHFSRLPRPWLFPCANFPYCRISMSEEPNYDHLIRNI